MLARRYRSSLAVSASAEMQSGSPSAQMPARCRLAQECADVDKAVQLPSISGSISVARSRLQWLLHRVVMHDSGSQIVSPILLAPPLKSAVWNPFQQLMNVVIDVRITSAFSSMSYDSQASHNYLLPWSIQHRYVPVSTCPTLERAEAGANHG